MTDRYRLTDPTDPSSAGISNAASPASRLSRTDTALWTVLAIAFLANVTLSVAGSDLLSIPAGAIVLGCGAALAIRHFDRKQC